MIKPATGEASGLPYNNFVNICHPGYHPNFLLGSIPAFTTPSGAQGVFLGLVQDACRILANNREGVLRSQGLLMDGPPDRVLAAGEYTYHIAGDDQYPICTTFRSWLFPESVPAHWATSALGIMAPYLSCSKTYYSQTTKNQDMRCIVTGETSRLDACHLVPHAEEDWWVFNSMSIKTFNPTGIDSPPNRVTMRCDLNGRTLDEGRFVFWPLSNQVVCICMHRDIADFAKEYHVRHVIIPQRVHHFNMYARFAYDIFRTFQDTLAQFAKFGSAIPVLPIPARVPKGKKTANTDANADVDMHVNDQDSDSLSTGNGSLGSIPEESVHSPGPQYDLCRWTEEYVATAETIDAHMTGKPLEPCHEDAGVYHGFSEPLRVAFEYRKAHPNISEVVHARVALQGEEDDEQVM
ncbi:hypothetical protein FB45DRAFT_787579 [Roridomyces roridus]|uniref:HNH nuclease domain-containing protein n=1 Tax=Roridomyces roridus TaxID=1738132 RepID=A0AAD7C509_9AGAR|nr:hypothetical protein FB45DRAFT_787579 [Roridomyces roridus]